MTNLLGVLCVIRMINVSCRETRVFCQARPEHVCGMLMRRGKAIILPRHRIVKPMRRQNRFVMKFRQCAKRLSLSKPRRALQ
jgi:hypothetical protein